MESSECPLEILELLEKRDGLHLTVGDKTDPNHFVESITFIHSLGEKWKKTGLFAQFRRTEHLEGDLITKNELRDQFFVSIAISNQEIFERYNLKREDLVGCLERIHLNVIQDDGREPYSLDYTRCATYKRYGKI